MTPIDIVHQRRLAAVAHAIRIDNVSQAARDTGISRQKISRWKGTFEAYGPDALRPKQQRVARPGNTTPDHIIEQVLRLAVTDPSGDARSYAEQVTASGYAISKSCVQTHLNRHGLGRRAASAADTSPDNTLNTIRSFCSTVFFDGFAIHLLLAQTRKPRPEQETMTRDSRPS